MVYFVVMYFFLGRDHSVQLVDVYSWLPVFGSKSVKGYVLSPGLCYSRGDKFEMNGEHKMKRSQSDMDDSER